QIKRLEDWVISGAPWPGKPVEPTRLRKPALIDDGAFITRVHFDVLGISPSPEMIRSYVSDTSPDKATMLVDSLLRDPGYADHWISFWLDLLAENPTLLNQSLNSTGPFRWFIYDALRDNKPIDRMITELIAMNGGAAEGGSAGFAMAGENDSPMAAKAHILSAGLLGIDMRCARCHDSPYHRTKQEDLYSIAAMLDRKAITPPDSSRVPDEFFENIGRESLISVTLEPGQMVQPNWPFSKETGINSIESIDAAMQRPDDPRDQLAALFTSPQNDRFPRVMVNHIWKRLMGAGLVEPVQDWEGQIASHPELLDDLALAFVASGYDFKSVLRRILLSNTYRRQATGKNPTSDASQRFFAAPSPRRLSAEQVVDRLHQATGLKIDSEELTFVHDASLPLGNRQTLGVPKRAWMFAGLNNERDRPSLSMPRAQSVVDVLEAFGWTGTRQKPIYERDSDSNVLQPGILANGTLTNNLLRASYKSPLADLALKATSSKQLLNELYLRFLSRLPNEREVADFLPELERDFKKRIIGEGSYDAPEKDNPLPQSTWTNHLQPEANEVQLEWLRRVRRGPPPDPRLLAPWREIYEDVIWSLVNPREFVWMP
ncbi:MAG: DUF1553 domain-containing protein, partial [Planctomycetota bacterium]